jgi:hypothetical protein
MRMLLLGKAGRSMPMLRLGPSQKTLFQGQMDVAKWEELLSSLTTFGGHIDPLDAVVVNSVLACKVDVMPVVKSTYGMFKGGLPNERFDFTGGVETAFFFRTGGKKGGTLAAGKALAQRTVDKRTFIWSLLLAAAWPPHSLWAQGWGLVPMAVQT